MPSFDTLPPELLFLIAQVLGSSYLRQSPENLLVCKAWYETAQSVAFEDVFLSITTLQRFLSASAPTRSFLATRVKKLELSIEVDHPSTQDQVESHSYDLCQHLIDFAVYLPGMARLREFRLKVLPKEITMLSSETWSRTLETLISSLPWTLTNLTIDIPGELFVPRPNHEDPHICSLLLNEDHLPYLCHLRLRMHSICPSVFDQLSSKPQPHLKTLVINLSTDTAQCTVPYYSTHCSKERTGFVPFHQELIDAAKAATEYLPSVTTVRIIRHSFPSLQLFSHDIVSGRTLLLPEVISWTDMHWDEEEYTYSNDEGEEQSDIDLFEDSGFDNNSSAASSEAPEISLTAEAALQ